MSEAAIAPDAEQPAHFAFSGENASRAKAIVAKYPDGRQASAVLPLLDLAQRQHDGWLPRAAIEHVADVLDMPFIRALEVATFYTMFNLKPVGKYLLQLCGTTPCWLRGSDDLKAAIREECGIGVGETSADGLFTLMEVECLGACVNAPMIQVNDDFYEDLDKESTKTLLRALKAGDPPPVGSVVGRKSSEPIGGATTLNKVPAYKPAAAAPVQPEPPAPVPAPAPKPVPASKPEAAPAPTLDDAARPPKLEGARGGQADDLWRISGVGPKIERILNELGVYHYDQIARPGRPSKRTG